MKILPLLISAAVFFPSPLFGREKTDIIVMKNGDHITCEIKGLRSNTLYIGVDYILSTLSVDWTKVDHVQSKQLFLVRTQDGTVYTGALSTPDTSAGRPLQIEVLESPEEKVTLKRDQVVLLNETSSKFWQRLNGHIGTGFTYSKGNASTQYNLNSDINYPRERWSAEARYSSNLTANSGASTSTRSWR
jgi:Holliday junction resolvase